MKFPLQSTVTIGKYVATQQRKGERYPLVLMLEPTLACNIACIGCGKIREYESNRARLTVEECLDSGLQCPAPVVSICGGEPLVYKGIEEVAAGMISKGKTVELCTNALRLEQCLDWFEPSNHLTFVIHLDGMREIHDYVCDYPGLWEIAVDAIKSIGYEGAGTLEFLLDRNGEFYFMEMNTRLQVEHPVTEAVTGLDLVELQLRVAAGEPLGLRQDEIKFAGHGIEVRLCSEDAAHDFMPQSGRMALWQTPDGLRVEHALRSGSEIPPFYDSMIAKLISHGATRDEARRRLICGLERTVAFGVTTNQAFLAACLRHPAFASGEATTAFIGKYRDDLLAPRKDAASEAALAALLLYVTDANAPPWRGGRTLAATFPIPVRIELDHGIHDLEIMRGRDGGYVANIDGGACRFEIDELGHDAIRFRVNGVMESARFLRDRERLYILHRGVTLSVRDLTLAAPAAAAAVSGGDGKVRAAMSGRVVAVLVKPGERVAAGQPVMTLEAMKMEHVHTAPISGTISAIDVAEGEQLTTGKVVVEIEAEASPV